MRHHDFRPGQPYQEARKGSYRRCRLGDVTAQDDDRFAIDLTVYLAARFALVAVIATLLVLAGVPLLVALIIALVVGLPLGLLVLRGISARVTAGLAVRGEKRKAERERLRAELRGDRGNDDTAPGAGSA